MLREKIKLIMIFVCFGLLGILAAFIPLSSYALVFYRALFGCIFMFCAVSVLKKQYRLNLIIKNIKMLFITGLLMGFNWVFMFMSMKIASVSLGTVCYNTSPIFIVLVAAIMLKDKITKKSIFCILLGLLGVILVSDLLKVGFQEYTFLGTIYGLIGALFYGLVVILNKKMKELNSYEKVSVQFMISAIIMIPFIIIDPNSSFVFGPTNNLIMAFIFLLIVGLFITGYLYILYFDSVSMLPAKTVAIFTYIDPVVALILSNLVLHEKFSSTQIFGTILILLATIINEFV